MQMFLRQSATGLRLLLVCTVLLGVLYPAVVLLVGRVVPGRADGSLVSVDGTVVGSELLSQGFEGEEWFQPRPSAAGDGHDPLASGASNLGPENTELLAEVEQRRADVAAANGVDPAAVPADAVTASGSGLDPHISPEYADLQVGRVARARGLDPAEVRGLVAQATTGPALGFVGEAGVNVLELNIAVQDLDRSAGG